MTFNRVKLLPVISKRVPTKVIYPPDNFLSLCGWLSGRKLFVATFEFEDSQ
ncbi:MAG: hypothetical protein JWP89_9 [Schlesneria sp.]|nr:hypothetical protein [Schlesneria sp.]